MIFSRGACTFNIHQYRHEIAQHIKNLAMFITGGTVAKPGKRCQNPEHFVFTIKHYITDKILSQLTYTPVVRMPTKHYSKRTQSTHVKLI